MYFQLWNRCWKFKTKFGTHFHSGKHHGNQIRGQEIRFLRKVNVYTRMTQNVREKLKIYDLNEKMKQNKLKWIAQWILTS